MFQKQIAAPSSSVNQTFFLFFLMMFFFYLGDAIMSYFAPVIMEEKLKSAALMGVVLACSSAAGIFIDIIFARYFSQYRSFFFTRLMFSLAFLFPISFLLGVSIFHFLFGMISWGITYEAMMFTTYHSIHESVSKTQHAFAWGMMAICHNLSLVLGPLIASYTYDRSPQITLFVAVMMYCTALILFLFYIREKKLVKRKSFIIVKTHTRSFSKQLLLWKTYWRVLWPILTFSMVMYLFDSAVYSIGPLLGEELKELHPYGGIFVSLYSVPGIFLGFFLHRLSQKFGKKRLAFLSVIFAGVSAVMMIVYFSPTWILVWMFISAFFIAIAHPAMSAVFEDLVSRSGKTANDIISLTSMSVGVSYVLGPIANGFLAEAFGNVSVFGIWGVAMGVSGILLLMFFPRKIKLPQSEVEDVLYD